MSSNDSSLIVIVWLDQADLLRLSKQVLSEYPVKISFVNSMSELAGHVARLDLLITSEKQISMDELISVLTHKHYSNLKGVVYFGSEVNTPEMENIIVTFCDEQCSKTIFHYKLLSIKSLIYRDKQLHEKEAELLNYHQLMLAEQTIAKNIFSEFMHSESIDYPELEYLLSPMSTYNGDILLAYKKDEMLYVMLGDFTGHGLSAAIGSIPTAEAFYAMAKKKIPLPQITEEINVKLNKLLPNNMFCAACMISYDIKNKILSLWQGGLPTGYLVEDDSQKIWELSSKNLPLGILSKKDFESDIETYQIHHQTKLVFFTDGFVEMKNTEGKVLDKPTIVNELIKKNKSKKVAALQKLLKTHIGEKQVLDDVAIVSIDLCA